MIKREVVSSVGYHDRLSFLNSRNRPGLHIGHVYESGAFCDHAFRTEMHVGGDSGGFLLKKIF
jgi:hypothetical protein